MPKALLFRILLVVELHVRVRLLHFPYIELFKALLVRVIGEFLDCELVVLTLS